MSGAVIAERIIIMGEEKWPHLPQVSRVPMPHHTITGVLVNHRFTDTISAINITSPVAPGFESPDPVPARLPVVGEGLVEDGLLVLHKTHQQ